MLKSTLSGLMIRDLEKLKQEILAYRNEETLWVIEKAIANSAGNLCLHLIGNLNTYIGAQFGNMGYLRNREAEFSMKNIPRAELLKELEKTMEMIMQSFDQLQEEQLTETYPGEGPIKEVSTQHFLIHLAMHLAYHLGQINYHRRLLDN